MFAHVDADAFFASVLQRKYPKLRGKPLLALGMGGTCVIAASYEAKRMGVKTGMHIRDARRLAPNAPAVPSDFRATCEASQQLFSVLEGLCPGGVERASPDEGFLDLHACNTCEWQSFAQHVQHHIHRFLDLPVSIGIAPTKTLAKMASRHRKPRGIFIVEAHNCGSFLHEKLINDIPGIGQRLTPKMRSQGFETAADLAHAPKEQIKLLLGRTGLELQAELNGIPVYGVITEPDPPQSISRCRSFRTTGDRAFLYAQVVTHLQRCSTKLRRHGMECGAVGIWLRLADYKRAYTEREIGRYISEEALLLPFMREAFEEIVGQKHYTQTGIVLLDLKPRGPRQRSLFEERNLERAAALQEAMDSARRRFGQESVRYGSAVP